MLLWQQEAIITHRKSVSTNRKLQLEALILHGTNKEVLRSTQEVNLSLFVLCERLH